jgi:small subunit ribosomal protein S1
VASAIDKLKFDPNNTVGLKSESLMYKTSSRNRQHAVDQPRESATERESKKRHTDKIINYTPGGQILNVGTIVTGTVKRIENYGIFVSIGGFNCLIHISEFFNKRINHPSEYKIGEVIKAIVISHDLGKNRVNLSIKQLPG